MEYFFSSLLIMTLTICIMSVGVIFKNRPIKGSCGGLNKVGLNCDLCKGQKNLCKNK